MKQENKELLLKDLCARLPYGVRGKVKVDGVDTSKHDIDGFPLEVTFDVNVELLRIDTGNDEIFVSTFDDNEDLGNYIEECQIDGTPWTIEEFTPYLRPMSSMTEEEILELYKIAYTTWYSDSLYYKYEEWITFRDSIQNNALCFISSIWLSDVNKVIDWLNAHHFDFRGLIKKGLALEAPKGMYN